MMTTMLSNLERGMIYLLKAPKLLLKGDGDFKRFISRIKNLEFTFVENKEENIYFTDSVQYTQVRITIYESN